MDPDPGSPKTSGSRKPKNIRLQIRIRITALAFLDLTRILNSDPDPRTQSNQVLNLVHCFIDNFAQILFPSNEVKPAEAEAVLPPLKKQVTVFVLFCFLYLK
jgi:hypothetical protein